MSGIKVWHVKEAIEQIRLQQLRNDRALEFFEAYAADCPNSIEMAKKQNHLLRKDSRQRIRELERFLAEDEAANWWKGEDRTICPPDEDWNSDD